MKLLEDNDFFKLRPSVNAALQGMKYLVTVAIQDAVVLATDFPDNPAHALLINNIPQFRCPHNVTYLVIPRVSHLKSDEI